MKNNPLTAVLLGVLAISAVFSVVVCALYIREARQVRQLEGIAMSIDQNRALVQSLAADAMEYSKRNPAIDPILESVGLNPRGAASGSNKPATR
jgi:hypothetical protein